jgi:hypothetical protein
MKISAKLVESNSFVRKTILSALSDEIKNTINKSLPGIKLKIQDIVRQSIKKEPEYESLKNGILRYEFGINQPSDVDYIVNLIIDTIEVRNNPIKITNQGLSGGFQITMIGTQDLNDISDNPHASVIDALRNYELPWLKWLLFEGGRTIVKKYEVRMAPSEFSRTGMALMVESKKNWKVPAQFMGTTSNNWIVRALEGIDKTVLDIIQKEIIKNT